MRSLFAWHIFVTFGLFVLVTEKSGPLHRGVRPAGQFGVKGVSVRSLPSSSSPADLLKVFFSFLEPILLSPRRVRLCFFLILEFVVSWATLLRVQSGAARSPVPGTLGQGRLGRGPCPHVLPASRAPPGVPCAATRPRRRPLPSEPTPCTLSAGREAAGPSGARSGTFQRRGGGRLWAPWVSSGTFAGSGRDVLLHLCFGAWVFSFH